MNNNRIKRVCKILDLSKNAIRQYGFRYFISTVMLELKHNKLEIFKPELESRIINSYSENTSYKTWLREHELSEDKNKTILEKINSLKIKPNFTIVLNFSNKNEHEILLNSLENQIYKNFEILICCKKIDFDKINERIKTTNLRIVKNEGNCEHLNKSVQNCSGEWIVFLNNVITITQDALFQFALKINENENIDVIYSDEDKWEEENRVKPFFKPDWSPDLFLSQNYIGNFFTISKKICQNNKINDSLQDAKYYDLLLKITDTTRNIQHITNVLCSIKQNQPSNVLEFKNVLKNALGRRKINCQILDGIIPNTFRVKYQIRENPKISIIIPTKDNKLVLQRCINSLRNKTNYKNFEIIIVDNNSKTDETKNYLNSLPYTVITFNEPFNFSKVNNLVRKQATGDFLLFLNDDTAALKPDWLENMVEIGQQEGVGMVGAKLVLGDNTIQHAGWVYLNTGAGIHPFTGTDAESAKFNGQINVIRNYSAVTGACQLIKTEIYDKVGGYDNDFDLYYGDSDLCMKVIDAGYRIVYTPYAKLLHQGSTSIKKQNKVFFSTENHIQFITKWKKIKYGDPFYNPNLKLNYRIKTE